MEYPVNVDVAVWRDGEFLLIKRSEIEEHAAGQYSLPGGTVEDGPGSDKVIVGTAQRELHEEVGIEVGSESYLVESTTFQTDNDNLCLNIVILVEYESGTAHVVAEDEVDTVEWRSPDEIIDGDEIPPWTEQSVERAAEHVHRFDG